MHGVQRKVELTGKQGVCIPPSAGSASLMTPLPRASCSEDQKATPGGFPPLPINSPQLPTNLNVIYLCKNHSNIRQESINKTPQGNLAQSCQ